MQSFIFAEVSDCGLLVVVAISFLFHFFWCFLFLCVRVCVSVCMCVRIWQFHVCRPIIASSVQNQILDMKIRYINERNVKYIRIHVYEYTEWIFASNLSHREAKIHEQIVKKRWRRWQAMAPLPIPLPCALTFPPPSHRDATMPSPCWAPHFMTQERIMFSNPAPSKPRLSPDATMSDDRPSAPTPPLHCASILQPATPPQVVAFQSYYGPSLLQFVSIVSPSLNHGNPILEPVCVFLPFPPLPLIL